MKLAAHRIYIASMVLMVLAVTAYLIYFGYADYNTALIQHVGEAKINISQRF